VSNQLCTRKFKSRLKFSKLFYADDKKTWHYLNVSHEKHLRLFASPKFISHMKRIFFYRIYKNLDISQFCWNLKI